MLSDLQPLWEPALRFLRIGCEIGILSLLIYYALLFVRGTRAATILAGIIVLVIVLTFVSRTFNLEVIQWLLTQMWTFLALSILIIFQPEIRRAFAELGSQQLSLGNPSASKRRRQTIETILNATYNLASLRIGALVAIEKDIGMRTIAETGTPIHAPLTSELLTTFFYPNTPLHDGGVIIKENEIVAAGCIFPLTDNPELAQTLGTRHRAAVGITEETDALTIIVSEETGAVSIASRGRLVRGVSRKRLRRHLENYFTRPSLGIRRTAGQPARPKQKALTDLYEEDSMQT